MKYIIIEEYKDYPVTIYYDKGRYFVDLHLCGIYPIHSYKTLAEVKEMLYYHFN